MDRAVLRPSGLLLPVLMAFLCFSPLPAQPLTGIPKFPNPTNENITGIAFHGGQLLAASKNNHLFVLDIATGQVVETVSQLLPFPLAHIHGMCVDGGSGTLWVSDMLSASLHQVQIGTWVYLSSIPSPNPMPYGMVFEGGLLWMGHHSEGPPTPLHAVDPLTGALAGTWMLGLHDTHGLAWVGGYLWALDNLTAQLLAFDTQGALRAARPTGQTGAWSALTHDGTRFWGVESNVFVTLDFPTFTQDPLIPGTQVGFLVSPAPPGSTTWFLASLTGVGSGPALPVGGAALALLDPIHVVGQSLADASNRALFTLQWPGAAPGIPVWTQAVIMPPPVSGGIGPQVTNALLSITQ